MHAPENRVTGIAGASIQKEQWGLSHLFYFLCAWVSCLLMYLYTFVPGPLTGQKRALGPLELELTERCELTYGRWNLNLRPLQKQPASVLKH